MTIDVVESNGPAILLRAKGRINVLTADSFEADVRDACAGNRRDVIIDGSAVTYLSSAGLRVFIRIWRDLNADNRNLHVCALKPYILEVFRTIGFDKLIPIHADVTAALDAVQGRRS